MYQSEQINELVGALAKAQGEIMPAIKDSKNPFFKSSYADLSSVWNACKEPLSKNGLAVMQTMDHKENQLMLITTLAHASGQWVRSFLPVVTEKNNAQGIGAAITYMRRYALSAMVGITCDEDDDGNASVIMPEKKNGVTQTKMTEKLAAVTPEQAKSMQKMLTECDKEFQENVSNYLKSLNVPSFDRLPVEKYKQLYERIDLRIKELLVAV
jgi:hypothetical protein